MIFLLPIWVFLYLIVAGVGLVSYHLLHLKPKASADWLLSFWFGWAIIIAFLQIWHLLLPITTTTALIVTVIGLAGLVAASHDIRSVTGTIWQQHRLFLLVLAFILLFMLAISPTAIVMDRIYDDGLYHIQNVKWINNFAIVPGLGNLQSRLAFNDNHTLFVALIQQMPLLPLAHFIAHGTFALAFLLQVGWSFYNVWQKQTKEWAHYFYVLVFPIVFLITLIHLGNIKNDYVILLLGLLIAGYILTYLQGKSHMSLTTTVALTALAVVSVTVKLSIAVFAGSLLLVMLFKAPIRLLKVAVPITLLVVGIWMMRGVILSGYPTFPATVLPFPVEWRMPVKDVEQTMAGIRSWAREPHKSPEDVLGNLDWVSSWVQDKLSNQAYWVEFWLPMVVGMMAALSIMIRPLVYQRAAAPVRHMWILPLISVIGLTYWWVSAPAIRFGWYSFWTFGISLLIIAMYQFGILRFRFVVVGLTAMTLTVIPAYPLEELRSLDSTSYISLPGARTIDYETHQTDSGLTVNIPTQDGRCWYAPLPCVSSFDPDLRLRNGQNLQSGFMVQSQDG